MYSVLMAEPEILLRGKEFHQAVQRDWEATADGNVEDEKTIDLVPDGARHQRKGRLDLFVNELEGDDLGGFVSVIEIKATDWDRVKHPRKLVAAHRRQVWRYIGKYLDLDEVSVCAGMIYPHAPSDLEVKQLVVEHLHEHCLQVVWYYDDEVA